MLVRIALPLSKAALATLVLFYAVGHWQAFFHAILFITKQDLHPLQVYLRRVVIMNDPALIDSVDEWVRHVNTSAIYEQLKYALIIVSILPIICLYPFLAEVLRQGRDDRRPEGVTCAAHPPRQGGDGRDRIRNSATLSSQEQHKERSMKTRSICALLVVIAAFGFAAGTEEQAAMTEPVEVSIMTVDNYYAPAPYSNGLAIRRGIPRDGRTTVGVSDRLRVHHLHLGELR